MKKIIMIYLCVIMPINLVNAELVYNIDLIVYKNDTVELNKIWLYRGVPSIHPESDYSLKILGKNNEVIYQTYLPVSFIILTEPPIETNKCFLSIAIPSYGSLKYLEVYHNEKLIFRSEELRLCNLNGICDANENYLSCPQDCPKPSEIVSTTSLPVKTTTITTPTTTLPPEKPKGFEDYLPYLVALFITILITFLIYRRIKTAREIEKERKESELMEFVKEKLKGGEDPKTLKKGLKEEGYDPELVDKVERRLWD